jgi:hypothetical protein
MGIVGAVGLLASRDIRRRWRSALAIALLIGIIGALVLAAVAGARRSSTSLDRFLDATRSANVEFYVGTPTDRELAEFRRAPGVETVAHLRGYSASAEESGLGFAAPLDDVFDREIDRSRIIDGRRPDPSEPLEVTVAEGIAEEFDLRPGSTLTTVSYTQEQIDRAFKGGAEEAPAGPNLTFRVVGVVRRPLDLGIEAQKEGIVALTPAFHARYDDQVGKWTDVFRVRTERGQADVERVAATARRMFGDEQTFGTVGVSTENQGANDAIEVLTLALWIVAAAATLAGLVAIGIVVSRDLRGSDLDQSTLRGLGLTRNQRAAANAPRSTMVAVGGALIAGIGAVCLSPFFPIGIARRADPDPGWHADWTVFALGLPLIVAVIAGISFVAARRAARPLPEHEMHASRATSAVTGRAAAAGLRPTFVNGLRFAIEPGRGHTAVPVRSAFVGAVFAVAGVTAALVFGSSLGHLAASPRLYGWNWELTAEVPTREPCVGGRDPGLSDVRGVEGVGVAATTFNDVQIDGRPVIVWCFRSLQGDVGPVVVDGRAPRSGTEIALGVETLRAIGKDIGDEVRARGADRTFRFRVVGKVALATVDDAQPLAEGAAVDASGFGALYEPGENETQFLLVQMTPGADRDAIRERLAAGRARNIRGATVPLEVVRIEQVDLVPVAVAGLLGLLGLIAVAHALVTSVRRHRGDLAMLKVLGFTRRQVRATVAWQSTVLAFVGLVLGIPVGLVLGRWTWDVVANGLGVATVVSNPAVWLILAVPVGLIVANLLALLPARAASRTRPAVALREG